MESPAPNYNGYKGLPVIQPKPMCYSRQTTDRLTHRLLTFAVFNEQGIYKGVIEVSQEIYGIQSLQGEKRLLDWK